MTDAGRWPNPPWSRDEVLLLMELYRSAPRAGRTDARVVALSELLNERARLLGRHPSPTFRNPDGIAMRLANFARLDPARRGEGGLRPGGAVDRAVWEEFGADGAALAAEAGRVRRAWAG